MKKTIETMKQTLMRNERFRLETKDPELQPACIEIAKEMGATWGGENGLRVSAKMSFYPSKDAYKGRLLDMKMPNNKRLRNCNEKDCLAHGGWLTYVGKNIGPFEVGEIYGEADLDYWKFANLPQA